MENLTLQQLINQTKEALIEAGASNYYQNVFKTLSKQLLLYAKEHDAESFSMDFGLQFLEDHYSMLSKIEQKPYCSSHETNRRVIETIYGRFWFDFTCIWPQSIIH